MKTFSKIVWNSETLEVTERTVRHENYRGPVDKNCGGDALANQKKAEANSQVDLNQQLVNAFKTNQSQANPFAINLLQNGNPYFNNQIDYQKGLLAQQAAPQRAQMLSRLAGYGDTLPSGFAEQSKDDFNANLGLGFDNTVANAENQNLQTKITGAQLLNPLGYAGAGSSAAGSVLSAPPVNSGGFGNFLGGLASGLVNNVSAAGKAGGMAFSI